MENKFEADVIAEVSSTWGFGVRPEELEPFRRYASELLAMSRRLDDVSTDQRQQLVASREVHAGDVRDDPFNAVVTWCDVGLDDSVGLLTGKRIGIKDNIAVADVPMTMGAKLAPSFVPKYDATVVERILQAGGRVRAKLNLDSFSWSGGGDSSDFGPTVNPQDPSRTAGGSSGGPAAALYYSDFDITLGTDQGGSVRLPASWCGVLGLKPTRGLVPYTGAVSMDQALDHIGPLTRTVDDMALAMQVISGWDASDPRGSEAMPRPDFLATTRQERDDLRDIRIGIVQEAFRERELNVIEPGERETIAATTDVIGRLEELGAQTHPVSIPSHGERSDLAALVWAVEGQAALTWSKGVAYGSGGWHDEHLPHHLGQALAENPLVLPPTLRAALIVATLLKRQRGTGYAQARNLGHQIARELDQAFQSGVDVLLMPTATHYAHPLDPEIGVYERMRRGLSMVTNTQATNMTGHPALSLPAAQSEGLPVGVMLIGKLFADADLLKVAKVYESTFGWLPAHR